MKKLTQLEVSELIADMYLKSEMEEYKDLRLGQIAISLLWDKNPELTRSIVGTDADCFYVADKNLSTDSRWTNFLNKIQD